MNIPSHVAIIMDGNGRWAKARGRTRAYGHVRGARIAKKIITVAVERKIPVLTLFTFSTENWLRPEAEVSFLMRLLAKQILREQRLLMKQNVQFCAIGDLKMLPEFVRTAVESTIALTAKNTGMTLVFALSYGGRQDITTAMREIAQDVLSKKLDPSLISEFTINKYLSSYFLPDPDLIIRTSGEQRLSNFFLWQAAYSEILLLDKHWPDFTFKDFDASLAEYSTRKRRFGRITAEATPI